jgi:uroporphyrinogen decarboxylase
MPETMSHKERQLATIRHDPVDRIPVDAINIENMPQIAAFLSIPEANVMEALGIDGRIIGLGYEGMDSSTLGAPISEWGTPAEEDYGTSHLYPLAFASTPEVNNYPWPDPARYTYASAAQAARSLHPEYAIRGPYWAPLFCRVCSLMGMEKTLSDMLVNPAIFEAVLEKVFERVEEICLLYVDALGESLDIFYLGDDYASQKDLLFSPRLWRRFLKPRYAKLFEIGKRLGKPVWFHSCGNILPVLPDLIEIGVDVWETVQLHTLPISPQKLKQEYGKHITFFGGINTQRLPFATPEEVAEEVRRVTGILGEGGGYICGPDHHIKPDVPPENAVALFKAAREYTSPDSKL